MQKYEGSKCQFERYLNDTVPLTPELRAELGTSRTLQATYYGTFLRRKDPKKFNKLYEEWVKDGERVQD